MAVSIQAPLVHVEDANGLPYRGALQYVYETQTTTLRPIFTDPALTIPAQNPQISNAKGDFPRVYTAEGVYKIRQEQKPVPPLTTGVLIDEWDNIDSGLSAGTVALPISRGGTGATTASAARANLDVPSNSELAAVSATIAAFTEALANLASSPQGRLTLTSNTPVISTGVSAASTVYYTPYTGQLCPVYDGVQFNLKIFPELQLVLNVNHVLNSIYDVYVINDSSSGIVLATGPAWSNIAAGSGSRAGTCDITRLQGLWVNSAQLTMRNGGATYTVAANRGTYVGSIYIDGAAGQVSCLTSWGQDRKWGVWNVYNRRSIIMQAGDSATSWAASTSSPNFAASNSNSANKITTFCGLAEENIALSFLQLVDSSTVSRVAFAGIGINSITTPSGAIGQASTNASGFVKTTIRAEAILPPGIGINGVQSLDACTTAATIYGTRANMVLTAMYQG